MDPEELSRYIKDPWISDRLEWLMENKPKLVQSLFEKDKKALLLLLCQNVKQAWQNQLAREKRGQSTQEAANMTFEEVVSPPANEHPKKQIPIEYQQKMREWLISEANSVSQTEQQNRSPRHSCSPESA